MVFLLFFYAIYLKVLFKYRENYKKQKYAVWEETVLNQLYSGDFAHLFSMDPKRREIVFELKFRDFQIFGEFIEDYLIDLRGEEYDNIIVFLQSIGFDKLLMKAVKDKDQWKRAYAAHFLGLMKLKKAEPDLLKLIYDQSPIVYLNAFEALHSIESDKDLGLILKNIIISDRIGTTKIIEIILNYGSSINPVLISLLYEKDFTDNDKRLVIDILSQKNVFESTESIREIARETDNEELKIGCIKALGMLEDPDSSGFLLENLNSENWVIRSQAVKSLGLIGDTGAIEPLVQLMKREENYSVILLAAKALVNMRNEGKSALESLIAENQHEVIGRAAQYVLHEESIS